MFLGDYMIKAMGHPLYAMIVMGSTVLINIGLDLLFIPVMGLGIKGRDWLQVWPLPWERCSIFPGCSSEGKS